MNLFDTSLVAIMMLCGAVAFVLGALALNIASILFGLSILLASRAFMRFSSFCKTHTNNQRVLIEQQRFILGNLEGGKREIGSSNTLSSSQPGSSL